MSNSIGPYDLLFLHGHPEPPRKGTLVIARPGVEGNALWRDVAHGRPFKMRSVDDVADLYDGRVAYNNYLGLIGQDPMDMVWEDQAMSDEGFLVCVLDVRLIDLHAIATPVGGRDPNNAARLECEWDLVSVLMV